MAQLVVSLRDFANTPKNERFDVRTAVLNSRHFCEFTPYRLANSYRFFEDDVCL